jgi:hypothetical protein
MDADHGDASMPKLAIPRDISVIDDDECNRDITTVDLGPV